MNDNSKDNDFQVYDSMARINSSRIKLDKQLLLFTTLILTLLFIAYSVYNLNYESDSFYTIVHIG
jgi:hypothetical protein